MQNWVPGLKEGTQEVHISRVPGEITKNLWQLETYGTDQVSKQLETKGSYGTGQKQLETYGNSWSCNREHCERSWSCTMEHSNFDHRNLAIL